MEFVYQPNKFDNVFYFVFYLFKEYSHDQSLTYWEDLFIKFLAIPSIIILCSIGCIAIYELTKYVKRMYALWQAGNNDVKRSLKYAKDYQRRNPVPDEYD